jgi:hypothetical protein
MFLGKSTSRIEVDLAQSSFIAGAKISLQDFNFFKLTLNYFRDEIVLKDDIIS